MPLDPEYLLRVFLVFVRIGGVLVSAPFFSHSSIPVRVKVFFAVLLAYGLVGLVSEGLPAGATKPVGMIAAVGVEALTGVVLGLAAQFVFWAVQFAGEIAGLQVGLSLAQTYNPLSGASSNPLGNLLTLVFLIVFLLLDGHHQILRALVVSFDVVPLAGARFAESGAVLLEGMEALFVAAIRLAAPFMVTVFLIDVALGVFARLVPQADLFSIGLPLKLLVGLGVVYYFVQDFVPTVPDRIGQMLSDVMRMAYALVG